MPQPKIKSNEQRINEIENVLILMHSMLLHLPCPARVAAQLEALMGDIKERHV